MDISPNSSLLHNFRYDNLVAYLNLLDRWKLTKTNKRWLIYEGEADLDGSPLEIVLPKSTDVSDLTVYMANAVNLLSSLGEESPETTLRRIKHYDSDVLTMRNVETGEYDSITLKLADRQISKLRQLIAYSACSEREPKPHFNSINGIGQRMVEHFRFGHTFAGSFGYTIESPLIHDSYMFKQEYQPRLFEVEPFVNENIIIAPVERRVMERVIRGFQSTKLAVSERNLNILLEEYASGFNANMCTALVEIAQEKASPVEYSVLWSPKLAPSEDIREFITLKLNETSYYFLKEAASTLKTLEPEYVRIRGTVTDLSSAGDPLGDDETSRSIAIRWINRPENARPVKVLTSVNKEDYVQAHKAHLSWSTIEVTGIVQRVGAFWRLLEPSDFEIMN